MVRRIFLLLLAFPAGVVLVTFAVANRHAVRLVLDPLRPETPVLSVVLPFYAYLFAALLVGIALGGLAVWLGQRRWRRLARRRAREALRWQAEADRLSREREARIPPARQLAPVNR
jgi:hypothetical protein